jgi:hypothetical protein
LRIGAENRARLSKMPPVARLPHVGAYCPTGEGRTEAMKYMLLIYVDEAKGVALAKEVGVAQMSAPYMAYTEALKQAGVIVGGDRLQPTTTATTVKVAEGKTKVLNGPYAETREQLAGYYMIDVADLDAALAWAARCPGAAHGAVEVRPLWSMQAG